MDFFSWSTTKPTGDLSNMPGSSRRSRTTKRNKRLRGGGNFDAQFQNLLNNQKARDNSDEQVRKTISKIREDQTKVAGVDPDAAFFINTNTKTCPELWEEKGPWFDATRDEFNAAVRRDPKTHQVVDTRVGQGGALRFLKSSNPVSPYCLASKPLNETIDEVGEMLQKLQGLTATVTRTNNTVRTMAEQSFASQAAQYGRNARKAKNIKTYGEMARFTPDRISGCNRDWPESEYGTPERPLYPGMAAFPDEKADNKWHRNYPVNGKNGDSSTSFCLHPEEGKFQQYLKKNDKGGDDFAYHSLKELTQLDREDLPRDENNLPAPTHKAHLDAVFCSPLKKEDCESSDAKSYPLSSKKETPSAKCVYDMEGTDYEGCVPRSVFVRKDNLNESEPFGSDPFSKWYEGFRTRHRAFLARQRRDRNISFDGEQEGSMATRTSTVANFAPAKYGKGIVDNVSIE